MMGDLSCRSGCITITK